MVEQEIKGADAQNEKKSAKETSTLSSEIAAFDAPAKAEAQPDKETNLLAAEATQQNIVAHPNFKVGLNKEIAKFSTADQIALGDLEIRRQFATQIIKLFVFSNLFVMLALGVCFWADYSQMASKLITQEHRIIDNRVIMTLL